MRLVFFGTPDEAAAALDALVAADHDVAVVVTRADKRRARRGEPEPSPVRLAAERLGLPVRTPAKAAEVADEIAASGAEIGVVVAYGQILPITVLGATPRGLVNVHYSLLPRWRGAAPVERAILAGDRETGVAIMQLEEGLDTGPVYATHVTPIADDETAGELRARLSTIGAKLLVDTLPVLSTLPAVPQAGEPTYADKLTVDEFRIDATRSATELHRLVRAGNPRPGAWARVNGRRLKVLRASPIDLPGGDPGMIDDAARLRTADGALSLDEVQPEGGRPMPGSAWRRGLNAQTVHLEAT